MIDFLALQTFSRTQVAPALAAGCPTVVKPAEATPFTALALAVRRGLDRGWCLVMVGD